MWRAFEVACLVLRAIFQVLENLFLKPGSLNIACFLDDLGSPGIGVGSRQGLGLLKVKAQTCSLLLLPLHFSRLLPTPGIALLPPALIMCFLMSELSN